MFFGDTMCDSTWDLCGPFLINGNQQDLNCKLLYINLIQYESICVVSVNHKLSVVWLKQ